MRGSEMSQTGVKTGVKAAILNTKVPESLPLRHSASPEYFRSGAFRNMTRINRISLKGLRFMNKIALKAVFVIMLLCGMVIAGSKSTADAMNGSSVKERFLKVANERGWNTLSDYRTIVLHSFDGTEKEIFCPTVHRLGIASLSYDASKIVFILYTGSSDILCMVNSDGSALKEIVEIHNVGGGLSLSPDGKYIAFVGKLHSKTEPEFDEKDPSTWLPIYNSLILLNIQTQETIPIIENGVRNITSQAWSPDSKEICFRNIDHDIILYNIDTKSSKCIVKGGGTKWKPTGGSDATWSPKGSRISYRDIKTQDYYLINPYNMEKKRIIKNRESFWDIIRFIGMVRGPLLWSPDGRFVLYGRSYGIDGKGTKPFVTELDTLKETELSQDICNLSSFGGRH